MHTTGANIMSAKAMVACAGAQLLAFAFLHGTQMDDAGGDGRTAG
jgi:hypothetical protein